MTKKDHQLIAKKLYLGAIAAQADFLGDSERMQIAEDTAKVIAVAVADGLKREVPDFNEKEFIKLATQGEL